MAMRRRILCSAFVAAGAVVVHSGPQPFEYSQIHMGMPVRIVVHAAGEAAAVRAATGAFARIAALDREMSDYRPDSAVSAIARLAPAAAPVSRDLVVLVTRAIAIARETGGAFDPTVAPLVALWRDARASGRLPDSAAIARARALVGWDRVEIDTQRSTIRLPAAGMRLDLGGIAKGYILHAALDALRTEGVRAALIEAGGDIVVSDAPPGREGWRIDIPTATGLDPSFLARASVLTRGAFATSGPGSQFVEIDGARYSHVIDPRTGRALTSSLTAHVIAADGATADALATAATVLGTAGLADLRAAFPDARIELAKPTSGVGFRKSTLRKPTPEVGFLQ